LAGRVHASIADSDRTEVARQHAAEGAEANDVARANLLGIFILEVSAAHALDRIGSGLQWQVGLRQGF
jgi:hypothetical protein